MSQNHQRAAYDHLLQQFAASTDKSPAERWRYLEAAHVVGQNRLGLHLRVHWLMLQFAKAQGNQFEANGQLRHLAMAPLGHLVRRMPYGNNGRAIVGPLQPMVPNAQLRACIAEAMQACGAPAPPSPAQKP
ncbi:MAG: DUF3703 domain-containing protein [Proteobacteria bacterium]|nr:DUF3703 domain-containing protein [Pseudomonadota bacterium]